jgi:hypothetical protein
MRNEFTALIERDGPWYIAYSPEIPGANGQGQDQGSGDEEPGQRHRAHPGAVRHEAATA